MEGICPISPGKEAEELGFNPGSSHLFPHYGIEEILRAAPEFNKRWSKGSNSILRIQGTRQGTWSAHRKPEPQSAVEKETEWRGPTETLRQLPKDLKPRGVQSPEGTKRHW